MDTKKWKLPLLDSMVAFRDSIERKAREEQMSFDEETEPIAVYSKAQNRIITQGETVYEVVRPEMRYLMGRRADQVIFDYAFNTTLRDMVEGSILCNSCVPKKFQIIDDRKVLY